VQKIAPAAPRWEHQGGYELRNPYGRRFGGGGRSGGGNRVREDAPAYAYEYEDQSASWMRNCMRVRHKQFGVGTVVQVEDQGDDLKVTVRFAAVGTKKLLARYAGLEPA
jgi:DNA helicase-2/ATP-dependent DNA helicase PcrA